MYEVEVADGVEAWDNARGYHCETSNKRKKSAYGYRYSRVVSANLVCAEEGISCASRRGAPSEKQLELHDYISMSQG